VSPKKESPLKPALPIVGYCSEDEVRSAGSSDKDEQFEQSPDKASDEEFEELTE
jgi:hypothetical protein